MKSIVQILSDHRRFHRRRHGHRGRYEIITANGDSGATRFGPDDDHLCADRDSNSRFGPDPGALRLR